MTKPEATSFIIFRYIVITSFRCPNLQREITRKNAKGNNSIFFKIFTRLSTHYSLSAVQVCSKLLVVRVFEVSSFLFSN